MRDRKIVAITIMITTILLLFALIANVNALPHGGNFGGGSSFNYAPQPAFSPPAPSWFPHSFPHIWSVDDVVNVFNEQSLEVKEPEFITETDRFGLPAETKDLIKFSIPSIGKDIQGCILSFELKNNLNKVRKYYADLNGKGHPHTWSFMKDNILIVIDGAVPEKKARQYESALTGLVQK